MWEVKSHWLPNCLGWLLRLKQRNLLLTSSVLHNSCNTTHTAKNAATPTNFREFHRIEPNTETGQKGHGRAQKRLWPQADFRGDARIVLFSKQDNNRSVEEFAPYFLGSTLLIKGEDPHSEIIDGQQALEAFKQALYDAVDWTTARHDDSTSFIHV
jgi:hypothetical protein